MGKKSVGSFNFYFLFFLLLFFLVNCTPTTEQESVKIAISKGNAEKQYGAYGKWLLSVDSTVVLIDMYHRPVDSALAILEECSGLLLTGGPDIFPGLYGKIEDTSKCEGVDRKRDTLELALINKALELQIPILGICRGQQILNVAFGGTLIVDIPSDFDTTIKHRCADKSNCFHEVKIKPESELHKTAGQLDGIVNSNHHQAIDQLSDDLIAIAFSGDGLIEAIQWKNFNKKPFLLAVQWHPERMDFANPLSLPIARYFFNEAKKYSINKETKQTQ
jgi:putative glutamine amidotransferase